MSRAIITLPLSPLKSHELGRMTTPIVGDALSRILNAKFYLSINLLDSYKNRDEAFLTYQKTISNLNLTNNTYWLDINHQEELLHLLKTLITKGFIYEQSTDILTCKCKIIDIEKKNLASCNPNNTHFIKKEDGLYCRKCGHKCLSVSVKSLVFDPRKLNINPIIFMPDFLNKDAKTFDKNLKNSYQVISRLRPTGINLTYNGTTYNIDIDFLWSLYLNLFKEEEKIVMCGNHELYQLYYTCLLEKCLNPNANTIPLATPFLTGLNNVSSSVTSKDEELTKKLGILFNLKWARKEKEYDNTIFTYLAKLSLLKKEKLYNILTEELFRKTNLNQDLSLALKRFNMQNTINKMKRG